MWITRSLPRRCLALSSFSTRYFSVTRQDLVSPLTLYQYATCPFCNRVKSYLDFMKVNYDVVEVNPISKKQIKSLNEKQVPVAVVKDEKVANSTDIIMHIHNKLITSDNNNKSLDDFLSDESLKWSEWSEKRLAVVLYPNITRTFSDSWAAFSYVSDVKEWSMAERITNRVLGPIAMYAVRNKIKKKHGIEDERAELLNLLSEWTDAITTKCDKSQSTPKFLQGENISLADLMVFGVLRGLKGLPAHEFVLSKNVVLNKWYHDVETAIENS